MSEEELLKHIDAKLDAVLQKIDAKPDSKKYLTAKEVGHMTGLHHCTILNRSSLDPDDPRYIPSLRFGARREYFERKVIERLFKLAR